MVTTQQVITAPLFPAAGLFSIQNLFVEVTRLPQVPHTIE